MFKSIASKLALTGALGLGLAGFAGAAPAFAADCTTGCPVSVTATVTSATTITGLTTDVSFPSAPAGTTALRSGAEHYTVSTNNASGYTLKATAATGFTGPGGATISNNNWTITETGANPQTIDPFNPAGSGTTIGHTSAPGSDTYNEDWSLVIPSSAPAGSYTNSITYMAVANA